MGCGMVMLAEAECMISGERRHKKRVRDTVFQGFIRHGNSSFDYMRVH